MCTAVLIGWNPQHHPRIWAHIRGHYWSAKIDNISLWHPDKNLRVAIYSNNTRTYTIHLYCTSNTVQKEDCIMLYCSVHWKLLHFILWENLVYCTVQYCKIRAFSVESWNEQLPTRFMCGNGTKQFPISFLKCLFLRVEVPLYCKEDTISGSPL